MNTLKLFLSRLVMVGSIGCISATSHALKIETYDDFNGDNIDTTIWDIDDSSATISLTGNGLARFDHFPNAFGDSAWLVMKQDELLSNLVYEDLNQAAI